MNIQENPATHAHEIEHIYYRFCDHLALRYGAAGDASSGDTSLSLEAQDDLYSRNALKVRSVLHELVPSARGTRSDTVYTVTAVIILEPSGLEASGRLAA